MYRFNVAKQWLDASGNPADKPTPEGTKAQITVTRTRHVYAPDTGWTAETPTAKTIELDTTATYTALWADWNETQSVYAQYNADGTVKSAWAYTYEVSEAAIDGYFGTQHLPADFPQQPSDYFTDAALTHIKEIYRQPLTDTLPEVTEKNYYVERFNVKVDKTWARFRGRDELTFCLIQTPVVGYDADGKEIVDAQQTQYFYATQSLKGEEAPGVGVPQPAEVLLHGQRGGRSGEDALPIQHRRSVGRIRQLPRLWLSGHLQRRRAGNDERP